MTIRQRHVWATAILTAALVAMTAWHAPGQTSASADAADVADATAGATEAEIPPIELDLETFILGEKSNKTLRTRQPRGRTSARRQNTNRDQGRIRRFEDDIWTINANEAMHLVIVPFHVDADEQAYTLTPSSVRMRGGRFVAWSLKEVDPYTIDTDHVVPTLARKVEVLPNSRVRWGADRLRSFGGQVFDSDLPFSLKLDPEMFERRYAPDDRRSTGRSKLGRDQTNRRKRESREAETARREQSFLYRDKRKELRTLPETFTAPMPERLWAVFAVNDITRTLKLDGPGALPWAIDIANLASIRELSKPLRSRRSARAPQGGIDSAYLERLSAVERLLKIAQENAHTYTQRAITMALDRSNMLGEMRPGDATYRLAETLVQGDDRSTRQRAMLALVRVVPPTVATANLMKTASLDLDPAVQLMKIRVLFDVQTNDIIQIHTTIEEANNLLANPQGPAPGDVLDLLMELAQDRPESRNLLTNRLRLDRMPDERLDAAISHILAAAAHDPLAIQWTNIQLLGLSNMALTRRSLDILASAQTTGTVLQPMVRGFMDRLFGPAGERAAATTSRLKLSAPIVIDSPRHNFLRAIQHADPQIRQGAWQVLPNFRVEPDNTLLEQIYNQLLQIAFDQPTTPIQIVDFFERQENWERGTEGMMAVAIHGDNQSSRYASRALMGSARPTAKALQALGLGDRYVFAQRLYANLTDQVPNVTALMLYDAATSPLIDWFGGSVAQGRLPEPIEWAQAIGGESRLLELVIGKDEQLAVGAVDGLLAIINAYELRSDEVARQLRATAGTSLKSLRTVWTQRKHKITMGTMRRASGPYELLVRGGEIEGEVNVGVLQLVCDGESIEFANAAVDINITETGQIRIEKPADLQGLGSQVLSSLPLNKIKKPIDLRRDDDGSWRGQTKRADTLIELTLRPTRGS